jgi:hypothetical protein
MEVDELRLLSVLDALISDAFDKANEDLPNHASPPFPFLELACLFSSESALLLGKLGNLREQQRSGNRLSRKKAHKETKAIPPPCFKVSLASGETFAKQEDLYDFFNAMLKFESKAVFCKIMKHGHAVMVTAGPTDAIVAAAAFVAASNALFVDAIAASHGSHCKAFKLLANDCSDGWPLLQENLSVHDTNALTQASNGQFQKIGLGSLLVALLSRIAIVGCNESPAVYLKANKETQNCCMSPSNGMWNCSSSGTAVSASFVEPCTPSFQARPWGMEEDNALDQSGGDLLDAMEFNVDQGHHRTLNTSVSSCGGLSQLLFQKVQF